MMSPHRNHTGPSAQEPTTGASATEPSRGWP